MFTVYSKDLTQIHNVYSKTRITFLMMIDGVVRMRGIIYLLYGVLIIVFGFVSTRNRYVMFTGIKYVKKMCTTICEILIIKTDCFDCLNNTIIFFVGFKNLKTKYKSLS